MSSDPFEPGIPPPNPSEKRASQSKDIAPVLRGWEYEPGSINVRKISGLDGREKIQMRLDLGLLQMEVTGRPDGERPHGCESLLEYFEKRLDRPAGESLARRARAIARPPSGRAPFLQYAG